MNYTLYCLEFINGVHFGRGNLDSSEITFHADTLFSALFQEALKMKKHRDLFFAFAAMHILMNLQILIFLLKDMRNLL